VKDAAVSLMILWLASYGLAVYGFGVNGVLEGLYVSNLGAVDLDLIAHWVFFFFPPLFFIFVLVFHNARTK